MRFTFRMSTEWPRGQSGNPSGVSKSHRKELRSLALHIRECVNPAEIAERLLSMARGKDPATGEVVSVLDQQRAMQMLLDRGWGQAAQHVIIEGEIRSEVIADGPRIERPKMSLEEINARRKALRELGVKPKIIDAESSELPALPAPSKHDDAE